jgi:VWFA-related protein
MDTGNFTFLPRLRALLVPLALAGALPAALAAPPAAPPPAGEETYYESIDVDVVNVEVVATDRAGRPVAGLAQNDFELYEDGKPVAISNFFHSDDAATQAPPVQAPPTGGAPNQPAPSQALPAGSAPSQPATNPPKPPDQILNFAVFVDNETLTPTARRPVLAALQQFFKGHVGTGDHVILASYDGGIHVTRAAAADPAALSAAVGKLMTTTARGGIAVAERRRAQREQEDSFESSFNDGPQGLARQNPANQRAIADDLRDQADLTGNVDLQRGRLSLGALSNFITSLSGLPGRKALLVVTGAFAVENGEPLLARLAEHANTNRVTVYVLAAVEGAGASAIDPEARNPVEINANLGAAPPSDRPVDNRSNFAANPYTETDALTGALHSVADRTGGLTAANLINPDSFLETVRRDVSTFYSLGFSPAHPHDGKVHKLAVKLKSRRDLALRYRDTYEDRSGDQRAASEMVASLVFGGGENPLGVELAFEPAVPAATGKGQMKVPVVVQVPLAKLVLLPQERFHEGKLTLFVATKDDRGRISSLKRLDAPVHVANDKLMSVLGQSVGYRVEVAVRPGEQTIAVGVRDELGHLDSTVIVPWTSAQSARAVLPAPVRPPGR